MDYMKVNNNTYEIIKLLGHGKGGYSYLVKKDDNLFVLKQIHHEPCDYYTFGNKLEAEINDYNTLIKTGIPMPKMLDIDIQNERILKEYIEGNTIFELVKNDQMKDIYIEQIKTIANILYSYNLNIDYFPTNFIVHDDQIYYIDYECNKYMDEWNLENWGIKYYSKTKEFIEYLNNKKD